MTAPETPIVVISLCCVDLDGTPRVFLDVKRLFLRENTDLGQSLT
jgi:hypothetical protein